jgi:hypothetical protein
MTKNEGWQDLGESGLQYRSYKLTWKDTVRRRIYKLKRPLRFYRVSSGTGKLTLSKTGSESPGFVLLGSRVGTTNGAHL